MTGPSLAVLRAAHNAAAPPPWRVVNERNGDVHAIEAPDTYDDVILPGRVECMAYCYGGTSTIEGDRLPEDAALIVEARNALPALLDTIDAILDLHRPRKPDNLCRGCFTYHPCATVRAVTDHINPERTPE